MIERPGMGCSVAIAAAANLKIDHYPGVSLLDFCKQFGEYRTPKKGAL